MYIGGVCPVPVLAFQTFWCSNGPAMSVFWSGGHSVETLASLATSQIEILGKILVSPIGACKQEKWHLFGLQPGYPKTIKVRGPFSDCPSYNC